MEDLSLHILDIAENSRNAGARTIEISVREDHLQDVLTIEITDDGEGMDAATVAQVADPFYTTRTTRRVGLGLPMLAEASRAAGGRMNVRSTPGKGTTVSATFRLGHIDRKPLGNMAATMVMLVAGNPDVHFTYRRELNGHSFTFDTNALTGRLYGLDLNDPAALIFIRDYITEQSTRFD